MILYEDNVGVEVSIERAMKAHSKVTNGDKSMQRMMLEVRREQMFLVTRGLIVVTNVVGVSLASEELYRRDRRLCVKLARERPTFSRLNPNGSPADRQLADSSPGCAYPQRYIYFSC